MEEQIFSGSRMPKLVRDVILPSGMIFCDGLDENFAKRKYFFVFAIFQSGFHRI